MNINALESELCRRQALLLQTHATTSGKLPARQDELARGAARLDALLSNLAKRVPPDGPPAPA